MLAGLTLFAPDGNEGLIKYRYRRLKIGTIEQLAKAIFDHQKKAIMFANVIVIILVRPILAFTIGVLGFLSYFKKLPNITKYHHCNEDYRELGVVKVKKEFEGTEEKYILLTKNFLMILSKTTTSLTIDT